MSDGTLEVEPAALHSAATAFGQAADGLSGLQADAPLLDAAAAVPALHTGAACRAAASEVADEVSAVTEDARGFSDNLAASARWYGQRDQAAANPIEKIDIPK